MDEQPPSIPQERIPFEIANGAVVGEATQEETEAFAADLQGLRHFGRRMGDALDLGEPWHGGFREPDYTLLWACVTEGTGEKDPARGVVVNQKASYFELINELSEGEE